MVIHLWCLYVIELVVDIWSKIYIVKNEWPVMLFVSNFQTSLLIFAGSSLAVLEVYWYFLLACLL